MDKIIKLDIPKGYEYIGIDLADGKLLLKKKSIEYPKTYEECCKVLGHVTIDEVIGYKDLLLNNLQMLLICRDAYWKIAGEKMDLCKSWKPEYEALVDNMFFTIQTFNGEIDKSATSHRNSILAFQTKEMRDTFYENFKDLIEQCKELL